MGRGCDWTGLMEAGVVCGDGGGRGSIKVGGW